MWRGMSHLLGHRKNLARLSHVLGHRRCSWDRAAVRSGAMGILRLAHVDVKVPDLDLATAYYTEVMGMSVTDADGDSVDLKCWDEIDHHSLRLRYHRRNGLDFFSFKVEAEDDL